MDYEKAYKEALAKMREIITMDDKPTIPHEIAYHLFPELAESEDERIRKELLEHCKNQAEPYIQTGNKCPQIQSWIDWLEKQNSNVDNANKEYWRGYREGKQEILDKYAELEKQGEQKPADKVEPKFKVGDWITFYGGKPFKILKVEPEQNGILDYLLLSQDGRDSYYNKNYVDTNARLWTIQDAKDGDVLAIEWNQNNDVWEKILIFKALNDIGVEGYGNTFKNKDLSFTDENVPYYSKTWTKTLHPATKEQRDLLFQKMHEAGYEWDAEKKELIKIEQKPAWSEEDEYWHAFVAELLYGIEDSDKEYETKCRKAVNWLKSLKQRIGG